MPALQPTRPEGPTVAAAPFALDRFQVEANGALDRGHSVLVCAPTGAGKTVVAEHAVDLALAGGGRAFYTTPIKALSNQKYRDLVDRLGVDAVGLLTGDNAINGDAAVVVMTTEVLRNMLYASSPALDRLSHVVLDEVHFLQDTYRGPVWEEVLIHLPVSVRVVALSATVSNAEELADWMATVRPPVELVVEHHRPVELDHHLLVRDRQRDEDLLVPTVVDGRANPRGERFDRAAPARGRGAPRRQPFATPHRPEVVEVLAGRGLLPAIVFVFSRAGCEDAVDQCVAALGSRTDAAQRRRIAELVACHVEGLDEDDLAALGYGSWLAGLQAGFAAHHAGMIPPFKEAVEACFGEGLIKVVFATETLALGINMPARTVVIEKLTKFTGEHHELLTPAQYTQLTGRAGRRGIDARGDAVVLWSPWVGFADVARLAASRSFTLVSAFRPTYNMAANLVRRYGGPEALASLNRSFAQHQADRSVVRLEARLAQKRARLTELAAQADCERGDVGVVAEGRRKRHSEREAERRARTQEIRGALSRLRPGDVVRLRSGPEEPELVVLTVSERKGDAVRLRLVDAAGAVTEQAGTALVEPPVRIGRLELPTPFEPRRRGYQRAVGELLARVSFGSSGRRERRRGRSDDGGAPTGRVSLSGPGEQEPREVDRIAGEDAGDSDDGAASCPDIDRHLNALRQMQRLEREIVGLEARTAERTDTLARRFEEVLGVLRELGYVQDWRLTARGRELIQLFHESDLLVAEALGAGIFDGLDAASFAGLLSCCTYEHRSPEPPPEPWFPTRQLRDRWLRLERLWRELSRTEARAGLDPTRAPDPTFFAIAHGWTTGEDLTTVLEEELVSAGDFVRNAKQLIDLAGQVANATADAALAQTAHEAVEGLRRGVVVAGSLDATLDGEVPP